MTGQGLAAPPHPGTHLLQIGLGVLGMGGLAWGPSRAAGSSWVNASETREQPLGGFGGLQGGRQGGGREEGISEELGLSLRVPLGFEEQASSYHLDMPGPQPSAATRTTGAVAYLAEVLLWVGGSVVVSPQWQLSLLGKKGQRPSPSWGLTKLYGAMGCIAS